MEQAELINTFLSAQLIFLFFWHWYVLPSGSSFSAALSSWGCNLSLSLPNRFTTTPRRKGGHVTQPRWLIHQVNQSLSPAFWNGGWAQKGSTLHHSEKKQLVRGLPSIFLVTWGGGRQNAGNPLCGREVQRQLWERNRTPTLFQLEPHSGLLRFVSQRNASFFSRKFELGLFYVTHYYV